MVYLTIKIIFEKFLTLPSSYEIYQSPAHGNNSAAAGVHQTSRRSFCRWLRKSSACWKNRTNCCGNIMTSWRRRQKVRPAGIPQFAHALSQFSHAPDSLAAAPELWAHALIASAHALKAFSPAPFPWGGAPAHFALALRLPAHAPNLPAHAQNGPAHAFTLLVSNARSNYQVFISE